MRRNEGRWGSAVVELKSLLPTASYTTRRLPSSGSVLLLSRDRPSKCFLSSFISVYRRLSGSTRPQVRYSSTWSYYQTPTLDSLAIRFRDVFFPYSHETNFSSPLRISPVDLSLLFCESGFHRAPADRRRRKSGRAIHHGDLRRDSIAPRIRRPQAHRVRSPRKQFVRPAEQPASATLHRQIQLHMFGPLVNINRERLPE